MVVHDLQLGDEGEEQLLGGLVPDLPPLLLEDALHGDLLPVQRPPVHLAEAAPPQHPVRMEVVAGNLQILS